MSWKLSDNFLNLWLYCCCILCLSLQCCLEQEWNYQWQKIGCICMLEKNCLILMSRSNSYFHLQMTCFMGCDLAEQRDVLHPAHSTCCVPRGTSWFFLSGWLQVPENLFQHKQLIIHVPVIEWMKWRLRTSEREAREGVEPSTLYLPVMQKI